MTLVERFYPESRFGGFSDIDGTVIFFSRIHALLQTDMTVLDVGCGRGAGLINDKVIFRRDLRRLRGQCRRVIGVDVDPAAAANPGIDEFRPIVNETTWPVASQSIDLIVSDFVLEHVADPNTYFAEVARVLRHGGYFCARTTNRIGYVALLARLIPKRRHAHVVQAVQRDRDEVDIFPTHYRANTVWKLRHLLTGMQLEGVAYGYDAEPSYLRFSAPSYLIGKYIHALTPPPLRTCLFVFAQKS